MKLQPKYNHLEIEKKWQEKWAETKLNNVNLLSAPKPYYNLMMYPYPSAEGLHVGNVYAFTGSDIHGRYKRMQGFNVFEPIGFDSGGIHSENFAIKMGVHPRKLIASNIRNFTQQLKMIGNMFDWNHTVDAMDPDYYKWTQWLFIQLFKTGLAYKKQAPVTWCPSCKTTVSDEQTEKLGDLTVCERCKTPVERKNMSQWFFKITDYAERLLENTYKLNWSEKVLATQRNWIGKSKGAEIVFELEGSDKKVTVFTTRPDTLYGCTFFCLAPEHPLVNEITPISYKDKVSAYRENSLGKTEQERKVGDKDKTGEFTGAYVINPVNGKRVPVWVADYVLMEYGEGAVMGVPAHDERDFAFAQKYGLEIVPVIDPQFPQDSDVKADKTTWREEALKGKNFWTGPGRLINSQEWNGLVYPNDLDKVIEYLEDREIGKRRTTYKLRDWCISRQRYWGPPIPMIYCPACAKKGKSWFSIHKGKDEKQEAKSSRDGSVSVVGWYPEPEENLPVELPEIEDYLPDGSGKSPLARHEDFYKTTCPHCGGEAYRETDVSDTFLDSSWYFLRYPSTNGGDVSKERSQKHAFDPELTQKWLPVSQYCGGAEHSVLHLLYSRFITMALHDMGHLNFEEPFPNFYAHGLIIKDGAKMSKSRGNVVNPDEYIQRYGTDVLRMYLSFIGPYSDGGDFRDTGIAGMERFVRRVWRLITTDKKIEINGDEERKSLESSKHSTIKRVTEGIERFKYNTSIAALMEYVNYLEDLGKHNNSGGTRKIGNTKITSSTYKEALNTLILLIAPFAPHLSEEVWQKLNGSANTNEFVSVHTLPWPKYEKERISADIITIAVQVNGKLRSTVDIPSEKSSDKEFMLAKAKEDKRVERFTGGKKIIREIVIPGKLVNLVVS